MHYSAELSVSRPKMYISGVERRKEAYLARYSCTIILVWEKSRSGIWNVYVCPYMENAIAVLSQIEEIS